MCHRKIISQPRWADVAFFSKNTRQTPRKEGTQIPTPPYEVRSYRPATRRLTKNKPSPHTDVIRSTIPLPKGEQATAGEGWKLSGYRSKTQHSYCTSTIFGFLVCTVKCGLLGYEIVGAGSLDVCATKGQPI